MGELTIGLTEYSGFYNTERPHQSLDNLTPDAVYRSGRNGGAMIVDKFSHTKATTADMTVETGQRRPAASGVEITA